MLLIIIVMTTVVIVGLAAIALAEPRYPRRHEIVVWNDDAERRLLRDRKFNAGWW
ncbi:MAG TPA: hypothetical protein VIW69_02215 [Candidatus Elarobacter sp.]